MGFPPKVPNADDEWEQLINSFDSYCFYPDSSKARKQIDILVEAFDKQYESSTATPFTILPVAIYCENMLHKRPIIRVQRIRPGMNVQVTEFISSDGKVYTSLKECLEANMPPSAYMAYPNEGVLTSNGPKRAAIQSTIPERTDGKV